MKISIVTPSFNQAEFVEQTLLSVLEQNYSELEYVVIDGGSTDGSAEIIKKYKSKLHYFISEKDDGHADALNKGFARTSGEIMAWLNSDDLYTPWTFKTVAEIFQTYPAIEWLTGIPSTWNSKGALIGSRPSYKNLHDYCRGNYGWIQQESVFWRRSLWEKTGGYITNNYELMVDGELWSRFFRHTKLVHVMCVLGGYRFHGKNRALQFRKKVDEEMELIVEKLRNDLPEDLASLVPDEYPVLSFSETSKSWELATGRRVEKT